MTTCVHWRARGNTRDRIHIDRDDTHRNARPGDPITLDGRPGIVTLAHAMVEPASSGAVAAGLVRLFGPRYLTPRAANERWMKRRASDLPDVDPAALPPDVEAADVAFESILLGRW